MMTSVEFTPAASQDDDKPSITGVTIATVPGDGADNEPGTDYTAGPPAEDPTTATGLKGELPTAWQLWKHIYGDVLFGNAMLRDLVLWDLALHLGCWLTFTSLLWAFFLGYLPFNLAFKIYFFGLMALFAVSTDIWGILLNAAILIRLRDKVKYPSFRKAVHAVFLHKRFTSLLALAGASTGVRMIYIVGNNIIPLAGVCILPALLKHCTRKRTGVAWTEQMDMALTCTISERIGYPTARHRAIAYYHKRWGAHPEARVRVEKVIIPPLMFIIFFVILPLLVVGKRFDRPEMMAAGFTFSIFLFGFVQFMRPLSANIYATAAYRYTEYGENEIFAKWPAMAPNAYKSLAAEEAAKKAAKEGVDADGWVHVEEGGQAEPARAEEGTVEGVGDGDGLARMKTLPLEDGGTKAEASSSYSRVKCTVQ